MRHGDAPGRKAKRERETATTDEEETIDHGGLDGINRYCTGLARIIVPMIRRLYQGPEANEVPRPPGNESYASGCCVLIRPIEGVPLTDSELAGMPADDGLRPSSRSDDTPLPTLRGDKRVSGAVGPKLQHLDNVGVRAEERTN